MLTVFPTLVMFLEGSSKLFHKAGYDRVQCKNESVNPILESLRMCGIGLMGAAKDKHGVKRLTVGTSRTLPAWQALALEPSRNLMARPAVGARVGNARMVDCQSRGPQGAQILIISLKNNL